MSDIFPERGGKVLLVTEIPFWSRDTGAAQRIATLCDQIHSSGFDLHVFFANHVAREDRELITASHPGLEVHGVSLITEARRGVRRRIGTLVGRTGLGPSSLPAPLQRPWIAERSAAFQRLCKKLRPSVVLVEYLVSGYLIDGLAVALPEILRIVDTIDVLSERSRRFSAEALYAPLLITPEEETEGLRRFDVLLAIQDEEAAQLRTLCPSRRVLTVGHGHLLDPIPPRAGNAAPALLFLGSAAEHNRLAVRFLLDEVWLRVRRQAPDAELLIAGGICGLLQDTSLPGVRLLGRVAQPRDAYTQADVVINPALIGSGLKIKNVEALCHGMPLVSTTAAAEGMRDGAGTAFIIGDDAAALADDVARLFADTPLRRQLAGAALDYARLKLTPESAAAPLLDLLREACYRPKG